MIRYHAYLGGFWYWVLIKFGKTKLSDEQDDKNRKRNLFFLCFINILLVSIVAMILIYPIYF